MIKFFQLKSQRANSPVANDFESSILSPRHHFLGLECELSVRRLVYTLPGALSGRWRGVALVSFSFPFFLLVMIKEKMSS